MSQLTETAMLVKPKVTMWSGRKQDNRVQGVIQAQFANDPTIGNFTKKLVKSDALDAFRRIAGEFRNYNYLVTLPWEDGGTRMLPATMYFEYREKVSEFTRKADQHASEFTVMYADLQRDAETFLGKLYRAEDYPDAATMRSKFSLSYHITPIPTIGDWRIESLESERDQIEADLNALYERKLHEAYQDLWGRLFEQVEKIHDRLIDPGAIFKSQLIDTASEVCDMLHKLNIDGNADLAKMATDVKLKLCGTNVTTLRANATTRFQTAKAAEEIMDKMAGYMTPA